MGAKSRGNYPHYPKEGWYCPACVFGGARHSDWCSHGQGGWAAYMREHGREEYEMWEEAVRKHPELVQEQEDSN